MSTLTDFANSLQQMRERLPIIVSENTVGCAKAIVENLSQHTPVDTGDDVSNWRVSVDVPVEEPRPAYAPSPRGRMRGGVWTHTVAPAITRANNAPALIADAQTVLAARIQGQPIFITNVLPYTELLDQGSSDQEPAGFVDRAVIFAREFIDKIRFVL